MGILGIAGNFNPIPSTQNKTVEDPPSAEKAALTGTAATTHEASHFGGDVFQDEAPLSPMITLIAGGSSDFAERISSPKLPMPAEVTPSSANSFISLISGKGFQSLSESQQAKALEVFDKADDKGRAELVALAKREVNGKSALVDFCKDGKTTLLDSLQKLATQTLPKKFARAGIDSKELLFSVMQEAANPGMVNQDAHGTCTTASMQYMLCKQNPAEYVRIIQELTSTSGKAELRGGKTLRQAQESVERDFSPKRSVSERIFQAAMMEHSTIGLYDNSRDIIILNRLSQASSDIPELTTWGLTEYEQTKGLEAFFGRGFQAEKDKDTLGRKLIERSEKQPTYARMKWGNNKASGHVVVVDKVENGRVYFHNPESTHILILAPNTELDRPPRILEDPPNSLESMDMEDFKAWAQSILIEKE